MATSLRRHFSSRWLAALLLVAGTSALIFGITLSAGAPADGRPHPHIYFNERSPTCLGTSSPNTQMPTTFGMDVAPCSGGYYFSAYEGGIYYAQMDISRFVTADIAGFHVFQNDRKYAVSRNHAYFEGTTIERADPTSFVPVAMSAPRDGIVSDTDLASDASRVYLGDAIIPSIATKGAPVLVLTPYNYWDVYVGIGKAIYYLCPSGPPLCETSNPLTLVAVASRSNPILKVEEATDSNGLIYALDESGNTYYRGVAYAGACGFTSVPCTKKLQSPGI